MGVQGTQTKVGSVAVPSEASGIVCLVSYIRQTGNLKTFTSLSSGSEAGSQTPRHRHPQPQGPRRVAKAPVGKASGLGVPRTGHREQPPWLRALGQLNPGPRSCLDLTSVGRVFLAPAGAES